MTIGGCDPPLCHFQGSGGKGVEAARKCNPPDAKKGIVDVIQSGLTFKAAMRSGMLAGLLSCRRYLRQGWVGEVLWSVTRDDFVVCCNFCVGSVGSFLWRKSALDSAATIFKRANLSTTLFLTSISLRISHDL